ncbi:MAG: hypothetical protein ACO1O6_08665 [Bacteroidota bacterium]
MEKTNHFSTEEFDELLGSVGYLMPSNELEILRFNKLYEEYEFKTAKMSIDFTSIIEDRFTCSHRSAIIIDMDTKEIEKLRMVARNGETNIPNDILAKMRAKHRRKNDGKE